MKTATPLRRASTAIHFRREIEKAEADGASRDDMTLHLTLADASHLKRDRTLAISDISFAEGTMRYLGVQIEEGGVAASILKVSETQ